MSALSMSKVIFQRLVRSGRGVTKRVFLCLIAPEFTLGCQHINIQGWSTSHARCLGAFTKSKPTGEALTHRSRFPLWPSLRSGTEGKALDDKGRQGVLQKEEISANPVT